MASSSADGENGGASPMTSSSIAGQNSAQSFRTGPTSSETGRSTPSTNMITNNQLVRIQRYLRHPGLDLPEDVITHRNADLAIALGACDDNLDSSGPDIPMPASQMPRHVSRQVEGVFSAAFNVLYNQKDMDQTMPLMWQQIRELVDIYVAARKGYLSNPTKSEVLACDHSKKRFLDTIDRWIATTRDRGAISDQLRFPAKTRWQITSDPLHLRWKESTKTHLAEESREKERKEEERKEREQNVKQQQEREREEKQQKVEKAREEREQKEKEQKEREQKEREQKLRKEKEQHEKQRKEREQKEREQKEKKQKEIEDKKRERKEREREDRERKDRERKDREWQDRERKDREWEDRKQEWGRRKIIENEQNARAWNESRENPTLAMAKSGAPLRDATQVAICPDQKALPMIPFIEFIIGTNGIIIANPKTPSLTLFTRPFKNEPVNTTKTIARRASELLNAYFAVIDVSHEQGLKTVRQPVKGWGLALEYLRSKNWPAYSVTEEKMQLVMVAFADARKRYLDNGGGGKKVPLKSNFFKTLAELLDRFNEMRYPPALPLESQTSEDATASTTSSTSADLPSRQPTPEGTEVSLFVSSPEPNDRAAASGPLPLQHDDSLTFSLFEELQQVKDDLGEARATIMEIKKEKDMAKRMVWCAVLPIMNELRELKGQPA
ncbi:hypothetical protein CcaCcLH18_08983 [Colletotrichum camelliae]|nr:hypothetical protein CcaCcLH18_08983 [Colletotrichum camelliae]